MPGNNKGIIYGLICPINNELRYIGQTAQKLNNRFIQHKTCSIKNKTHLGNWLRKLKKLNLLDSLEIVILDKCDIERLIEKETYYINFYIIKGYDLVNEAIRDIQTNRVVFTEKQKQRRKEIAIETHTGRKRSEETKANMSKARKLYLANNKNPNLGRKMGGKTRKLMSDKKPKTKICSLDFYGNIIKEYESINSVKKEGFSPGTVGSCIHQTHRIYKEFFWRKSNEAYITREDINKSRLYVLVDINSKEIIIDLSINLVKKLNVTDANIWYAQKNSTLLQQKYKVFKKLP